MRLLTRSAAAVAGVVVASGVAFTVAPAASAAAHGGCNKFTKYGWQINVCITVTTRDHQVHPYFEVVKAPQGSGCHLVTFLARGNKRISGYQTFACKKGKVPYSRLPTARAHGRYTLQMDVVLPKRYTFIAYSPALDN
jgi:hypothetical protein